MRTRGPLPSELDRFTLVDDELVVFEVLDVVLGAEVEDGDVVELLVLLVVAILLILSVSNETACVVQYLRVHMIICYYIMNMHDS